MSNILIIKHGSLGDIAQISGVIRDIREAYSDKKIFFLTTLPYVELLSKCPYIDGVLIDLYKITSFLLAFGSTFLKLEGKETLPFLSILLIYLETNKSIKYGLSCDYMGVNGYMKLR